MVQTTHLGNAGRLWGHLSMAQWWPWNHRRFNISLTPCCRTKPKESNSSDARGWEMLSSFGIIITNCWQWKKWMFLSVWVQSQHGMNKNSWFWRQRIALFALSQSLVSSSEYFKIFPSALWLWIQVVSQLMKLLFCLFVEKLKVVKAVFHNNLTFHSTHPLPTKPRVSSFKILKGCGGPEIQTALLEETFRQHHRHLQMVWTV